MRTLPTHAWKPRQVGGQGRGRTVTSWQASSARSLPSASGKSGAAPPSPWTVHSSSRALTLRGSAPGRSWLPAWLPSGHPPAAPPGAWPRPLPPPPAARCPSGGLTEGLGSDRQSAAAGLAAAAPRLACAGGAASPCASAAAAPPPVPAPAAPDAGALPACTAPCAAAAYSEPPPRSAWAAWSPADEPGAAWGAGPRISLQPAAQSPVAAGGLALTARPEQAPLPARPAAAVAPGAGGGSGIGIRAPPAAKPLAPPRPSGRASCG